MWKVWKKVIYMNKEITASNKLICTKLTGTQQIFVDSFCTKN
jgi:hypothetical protein